MRLGRAMATPPSAVQAPSWLSLSACSLSFDFDYEDDVDQLCMGWDDLEDSAPVIATRCFEDRDPYDAQIYWKIL